MCPLSNDITVVGRHWPCDFHRLKTVWPLKPPYTKALIPPTKQQTIVALKLAQRAWITALFQVARSRTEYPLAFRDFVNNQILLVNFSNSDVDVELLANEISSTVNQLKPDL
ncbi:hypothetical protein BR1R5_22930 [Pseudomonas sp. BR1R-5]|nr:hypothetical protein BR1R5_22930 [Pseudomonas sp. BR1R-5]